MKLRDVAEGAWFVCAGLAFTVYGCGLAIWDVCKDVWRRAMEPSLTTCSTEAEIIWSTADEIEIVGEMRERAFLGLEHASWSCGSGHLRLFGYIGPVPEAYRIASFYNRNWTPVRRKYWHPDVQ